MLLPSSTEPAVVKRNSANRDYGIATLEEVSESFEGVVLNLDLKRSDPEVEPYEELLATNCADSNARTRSSWHRSRPLDPALSRSRQMSRRWPRPARPRRSTSRSRAARSVRPVWRVQVPVVFGRRHRRRRTLSSRPPTKRDLAVHVWTINDLDEMDRLRRSRGRRPGQRPTYVARRGPEGRGVAWDGVL